MRKTAEGFVAAAAETFAGVPGDQTNRAELVGVQHLIPAAINANLDQTPKKPQDSVERITIEL